MGLQPKLPRDVGAEQFARADVAAQHGYAAVPGLPLDVAFLKAVRGGTGGQAGAEAMPGEQRRIKASGLGTTLTTSATT
jgi:hypothetical protein